MCPRKSRLDLFHFQLDYFGVSKAVFDYFVNGERLRGGSTISNQLVRTVIWPINRDHSGEKFLRSCSRTQPKGISQKTISCSRM
jgi:Transglycosylase